MNKPVLNLMNEDFSCIDAISRFDNSISEKSVSKNQSEVKLNNNKKVSFEQPLMAALLSEDLSDTLPRPDKIYMHLLFKKRRQKKTIPKSRVCLKNPLKAFEAVDQSLLKKRKREQEFPHYEHTFGPEYIKEIIQKTSWLCLKLTILPNDILAKYLSTKRLWKKPVPKSRVCLKNPLKAFQAVDRSLIKKRRREQEFPLYEHTFGTEYIKEIIQKTSWLCLKLTILPDDILAKYLSKVKKKDLTKKKVGNALPEKNNGKYWGNSSDEKKKFIKGVKISEELEVAKEQIERPRRKIRPPAKFKDFE